MSSCNSNKDFSINEINGVIFRGRNFADPRIARKDMAKIAESIMHIVYANTSNNVHDQIYGGQYTAGNDNSLVLQWYDNKKDRHIKVLISPFGNVTYKGSTSPFFSKIANLLARELQEAYE